ncbi:MAG: HD domain-containing protein, partial [Bacteroidales bacterium]|nr:HD domain-containing protein [Bacteroidales bacterium]
MRINQDKIQLNEYYTRLTDFFSRHFGNTSIPSHDLSHHNRVWMNASYLINQMEAGPDFVFDNRKKLQVLIACMLHDIGMAKDSGVNHGRESRKLCEIFLHDHIPDESLHPDILIAVENHDNKKYTNIHPPDSLLTILSVADDIDAFGFIGVYRYL